MRQKGGFTRNIGPNGLKVDFENRVFQLGVTGALPATITHANVREAVIEMIDELLDDAQPHFDRVEAKEPTPPPPGPEQSFVYVGTSL